MSIHKILKNERTMRSAVMGILVSFSSPAVAAPGDLDIGFRPSLLPAASAIANVAMPDQDGNVLIGGDFVVNSTGSLAFLDVVKFTRGGELIPSYRIDTNGSVFNILSEADGTAFYSGYFTGVKTNPPASAVLRRSLAKFNSSGALLSAFNPHAFYPSAYVINSVTKNSAGNLLASTPFGFYSLTSAGALVPHPPGPNPPTAGDYFYSYTAGEVYGARVLPGTSPNADERNLLIFGPFINPGINHSGVNTRYLEKLNSRGRFPVVGPEIPDPVPPGETPLPPFGDALPFSPDISTHVECVAVQPDGKILVGGAFFGIIRLNADGTVDPTFRGEDAPPLLPDTAVVRSIALQGDGKILIGGDFNTIRGVVGDETRKGIARLHPDGYFDSTFDAKINSDVYHRVNSIALQDDGKILITGVFIDFTIGTTVHDQRFVARLQNDDTATQTLSYDGMTAKWIAGGTFPQATAVTFEYRPNGIGEWIHLGHAEPSATGWTYTDYVPLPVNTQFRAIVQIPGGMHGGSSTSLISPAYTYQGPKIAISKPPGEPLPNNSVVDLGDVPDSGTTSFTFQIHNQGDAVLNIIDPSFSGGHASQFSVVSPAQVDPGSSAPLTIEINPLGSPGSRDTMLSVVSNDPEPTNTVFFLNLTANVRPAIELFREQYFGTSANTGDAADDADPDGDGQTNYFEFIAGLDPTDPASKFEQIVSLSDGIPELRIKPVVEGRTYEVLTSTSLESGSWSPFVGTIPTNLGERIYVDENPASPRRFYRVRIVKP